MDKKPCLSCGKPVGVDACATVHGGLFCHSCAVKLGLMDGPPEARSEMAYTYSVGVAPWLVQFLGKFDVLMEEMVSSGMPPEAFAGIWPVVVKHLKGHAVIVARKGYEK